MNKQHIRRSYLDSVITALDVAQDADESFESTTQSAHVLADQERERSRQNLDDEAKRIRDEQDVRTQRMQWRLNDLERIKVRVPAALKQSRSQSSLGADLTPEEAYRQAKARYIEAETAFTDTVRDYEWLQRRLKRRARVIRLLLISAIISLLSTSTSVSLNNTGTPASLSAAASTQRTIAAPTDIRMPVVTETTTTHPPRPTATRTTSIGALPPSFTPTSRPTNTTVRPPRPTATRTTSIGALPPSFTPTSRPTNTTVRPPRPTATERVICPGLIEPRLVIGERAQVAHNDSNNIRSRPGTSSPRIGSIPGGSQVTVLDGPVCADGYVWWLVDFERLVGWTAEGGTSYWIRPLDRQTSQAVVRRQTAAAFQMFDNGYMIWLEYSDQIYVLFSRAEYLVFGDIFDESQSEQTIGIQPPPLRFEPRRGFGLAWRHNEEVRRRLGWALHIETGYTATVVYDPRTRTMTITGPERQFFTLYDDGRWTGG
jgi:uncharacterized protein YgiM (DUF1202 family)